MSLGRALCLVDPAEDKFDNKSRWLAIHNCLMKLSHEYLTSRKTLKSWYMFNDFKQTHVHCVSSLQDYTTAFDRVFISKVKARIMS